ncbi:MAG: glucose-6-phosphate isomerase, partial [Actinomycetota bacterium]
MTGLRQTAAWSALEAHHAALAPRHLRELFAEDPARGETLVAEGAGLYLDYSKHRITQETVDLLVALAAERGLAER